MSNGKNPKVAVAASANAVSGTGEPAVNGYYYLDGKLPSSACYDALHVASERLQTWT